MGKRREAKHTEVDVLDLADALRVAWQEQLGTEPSDASLSVLLAHSALETGHWRHCRCFNLGNVKATASWSGDYCYFEADEVVPLSRVELALSSKAPRRDGKPGHNLTVETLSNGRALVTLYPDHPWCRFRAFASLNDGAADYLGLLHDRFADAWPALQQGDPEQFVQALKAQRYFTASLERYLPPVLALFKKYSRVLAERTRASETQLPVRTLVSVNDRPTLRALPPDPHVVELQHLLVQQGYGNGLRLDGLFDSATREAVEVFQLQHLDQQGRQLASDGIVGKKTWWALLNPSGEAQRSLIDDSPTTGLTAARQSLLELIYNEHAKPVVEVPDGSNRSPDIDKYWGRTGLIGLPWCAAFVSWALFTTLGRYPIKKHHVGVQVMWAQAKKLGMETEAPKPGDIFIQIKASGKGHTGFVVGVSEDEQTIYTCEGNAGNRVKLGQRSRSAIHHFIDAIADDQTTVFKRGENVHFEPLDDEQTV